MGGEVFFFFNGFKNVAMKAFELLSIGQGFWLYCHKFPTGKTHRLKWMYLSFGLRDGEPVPHFPPTVFHVGTVILNTCSVTNQLKMPIWGLCPPRLGLNPVLSIQVHEPLLSFDIWLCLPLFVPCVKQGVWPVADCAKQVALICDELQLDQRNASERKPLQISCWWL